MVAMPRCAVCSQELAPSARFCSACGTPAGDQRPRLPTGLLPSQHLLHTRYLVLRKLAQGGQSAVYLASDSLEGNRQCAIKEMSDTDLSQEEREKAINGFMREAKMLSNLSHPSLATVYDIFVEDAKHYLVMEFVPGHNLEDEMMNAGHPLEWQRVSKWGIELCDVLDYLHCQQPAIIYRDLKPPNVMLTPDGSLKLIDFGIARWLLTARLRDTTQLGTDGYAPPEQYAARSEPRSDIYALGASMYHLLTGRVPDSAPLRMAGRTLTPIRSINPGVPDLIERVVAQALSLQVADRFATAAHMRQALDWAVSHVTPGVGNAANRATRPPAHTSGPVANGTPAANPSARSANGTTPAKPGANGAQPHLYVWPLRLDAGFLEVNQSTALMLEVGNRGAGMLSGRTETNLPSLTTEPSEITGETSTIRVKVNATNLPVGPYVCHLAIRTNGGDQIIPVRFVVQAAGTPAKRRFTQQ